VLFWLPPESPAKMVLGMNIFTSFFVLLLLLSKNVPSATDKIPLIGAYYCLNMVMIATSTCSCTAVVHIYFRGQGQVPYLIRKIFLEFLARIFCMTRPPVLPPPPPQKRSMSNAVRRMKTIAAAAAAAIGGEQPAPAQTQTSVSLYPEQPVNTLERQQRAASIITSINNNPDAAAGDLVHHLVDRSPNNNNNNNNRLAKMSSSCVALSNASNENEVTTSLLPPNSNTGFGGHPLAPPYNQQPENQVFLTVNGAQPSQFNFVYPRTTASPPVSSRHHQQHQQAATSSSTNPLPQIQQNGGLPTAGNQTLLNNELSLSFNLIENDIKEIRDYLRHTRKKLETTDAKAKQTNEWKQVALVLDRTLFFLYIIAIVVSVNLMFPK
jgi:hypothetical protein